MVKFKTGSKERGLASFLVPTYSAYVIKRSPIIRFYSWVGFAVNLSSLPNFFISIFYLMFFYLYGSIIFSLSNYGNGERDVLNSYVFYVSSPEICRYVRKYITETHAHRDRYDYTCRRIHFYYAM